MAPKTTVSKATDIFLSRSFEPTEIMTLNFIHPKCSVQQKYLWSFTKFGRILFEIRQQTSHSRLLPHIRNRMVTWESVKGWIFEDLTKLGENFGNQTQFFSRSFGPAMTLTLSMKERIWKLWESLVENLLDTVYIFVSKVIWACFDLDLWSHNPEM